MSDNVPITVAFGDGIGPEIMETVLDILKEAHAQIHIDSIQVGKEVYEKGHSSGIAPSAWDTIKRNKVLLKAPITTPQGGGYKSLNVTIRRTLGLYANIRPSVSYAPFVETKFPKLNIVVVRENEEGLYSGIEHRQTQNAYQSLKLVTRSGCERINQFAFDYAVKNGRNKVTCLTKDNILKMTDGLFHACFDTIAKDYPNIENEHYIIDIGTARVASDPEYFDVIVTGNLYGDIVSDIVSEISGSVGMSGSANIGDDFAMFEAVHGSAPDIAGKGIANPSGLLHGAIMMLVHIGQADIAEKIHNAWLKTIEDGIHTGDIYSKKHSKEKVGTEAFKDAVIQRLGEVPKKLPQVHYQTKTAVGTQDIKKGSSYKEQERQLVGVDVFFNWEGNDASILANMLLAATENTKLKLQMVATRGLKVWPDCETKTLYTSDYWRGRFFPEGVEKKATRTDIIELLTSFDNHELDFTKIEHLLLFDGEAGFSLAQGE